MNKIRIMQNSFKSYSHIILHEYVEISKLFRKTQIRY